MLSRLLILLLSITSIVDANVQCPTLQFRPEVIKNQAGTWTIQWSQLTPATTGGQVQFVDIHITRNAQQLNYRMNLSPYAYTDNNVQYYTFQDQPLALGETITYSFTYIVSWPDRNTIFGCDSTNFEFTVPGGNTVTQAPTTAPTTPPTCPTLTFDTRIEKNPAATWTVQWFQSSPSSTQGQVNSVDIHVTRGSGVASHIMTRSPYSYFPDHSVFYYTWETPGTQLQPGEHISYTFSYHVQSGSSEIVCTTQNFEFNVPNNAVTQAPTPSAQCPTLTFTSRIEKNPAATWTLQWFQATPSTTDGDVTAIDLHVTRTSGATTHVMTRSPYSYTPDHSVFYYTWETPGTGLQPGESLTYSFTYHVQISSGGEVACTTDTYEFTLPGVPAPPQPRSCPVVTITSHVEDAAGRYTFIADAGINPDPIDWVDIHVMAASGFYNYRTQLSSTSTSSHPIYELTLPVPLGAGETIGYYYTVKTGSLACDTEKFSYTTPGTPAGNPTQGATPATGEICPVISFTQAITPQGGIYTVQLTPTTSRPIEWIDVHIKTNTDAEYHARMDAGYSKVLPSYITSASSATYYFTSSSQTTVCNSNTFVWNK